MKYIIGVDSGGTSTEAVAYNEKGESLKRAIGGFGNMLNDKKSALKNIKKTVDKILEELTKKKCQAIIFGIAGIDSGNFKETVYETFASYSPEIVVLNDAWLAHYALLQGKAGGLIISGTGSIAIGRYKGKEERVGGWGNLLGDEGSGYDIAKNLIVQLLQTYDQDKAFTPLQQSLLDHLNFTTPFELTSFVYSSSKDQVAELSLLVSEAAKNKNDEAIELLNNAGEELGRQAILLVEKINMGIRPNIAVTGSVLSHNDIVYQAFKKEVSTRFDHCTFINKKISNTIGAFYYYKSYNE